MLVVDASCLAEVLIDGESAEAVRGRLALDDDQAAPHAIDAEVIGVVRRHWLAGLVDETTAQLAVDDLATWPGQRFGHRLLLPRAWELRHTVRSWDGLYVALAEALGATLLTTDARLAAASGPTCRIEVVLA
jgi:predicted nucleic acid-binding protein